MRRFTKASLLASILLAGLAASPVLYAAQGEESSGSMMGHGMTNRGDHGGGMMGMGRMTRQMSRMMDQCGNMMSGSGRPNEQWRKN